MLIKILAGLAVLSVHAMAASAPLTPPLPPMTPTGPWNVEFADSMCLLSRPYGSDRATRLIFKPGVIGDDVEIIVMKATKSISSSRFGTTVLSISDQPIDANMAYSAYNTKALRLLRIQAGNKMALAKVNGAFSIDAGREGRVSFAVSGISRALPVLADCVKQLRAVYKIDEAEITAIATWPTGKLVAMFSTNDYPGEALRNEQSGTVGVLLWVDPDGRISSCQVVESSASPVLEATTCSIFQRRARLTPAMNNAGKPVRAPVFTRVRWMLPTS